VLLPHRLEHTSIAYAHPIASVVMIESEKKQNVAPIRRAEVISDRRSAFFGNEFASEMTCESHNLAQPHAHDPQSSKGQSEKTRPLGPRGSALMTAFWYRSLLFFAIITTLGTRLARAEDLEAGKSASKLFSTNCSICHSSPRTLLRRMDNWALTDFLQKHYTASQTAAYELATYLVAISSHSSRGKQQPNTNRSQQFLAHRSTMSPRPPERVPTQ